jgi:hypothetical protein
VRRESPEECASRAETFFSQLARVDPSFSRWFKQGNTRREALKHLIVPDRPTLEKMFRRGKDRVFEDLGFRINAWNGGEDDEASSFYARCGGYSQHVHNVCMFQLPTRGSVAERVLTAPALAGLVRAMAMAWEPAWAIAMSNPHRELMDAKLGKPEIWVGWVTYLARSRGSVPPLPAPVRVEPVEDKGTLLVLTPERFSASNPEHVALGERTHALLEQAGLLGPWRQSA